MSGDRTMTTYGEMADVLASLPSTLREVRRIRRLSLRAAATQIGLSFSTLHRIEAGDDAVMSNVSAVLRWLDRDHACTHPPVEEPS